MPRKSGADCLSWSRPQSPACAAVTNRTTAITARISRLNHTGPAFLGKANPSPGFDRHGGNEKIILPRDLTTGMTPWRFKGAAVQATFIRQPPDGTVLWVRARPYF